MYDRDSPFTTDDNLYTREEQNYLANAVQKAVNDIKLKRKNPNPQGTSVPFSFMFIGGTDNIVATKEITPIRFNTRTQKSRFIGYTNLIVLDEKVNPEDEYYYTFTTAAPAMNEDIVATGKYIRFESPVDISCNDGQIIMVVEVDSNKRAIRYDSVAARIRTSDFSGLEVLNIEPLEGTTDYHMRLNIDPPLTLGNTYMYAASTTIPENGELVPFNYIEWNGTGEIDVSMFNDKLITLVECNAISYTAYKVGTFRAYANEVLKNIDLVSTYGHSPETTILYVAPSKIDPTNTYYVSNLADESRYDAIIPNDYRWKYWDGTSEVKSELGEGLAVVECTKDGRARKFGYLETVNVNNEYNYYIDPVSVTYSGYINNIVIDPNIRLIYYKPYAASDPWVYYGESIPPGYTAAIMTGDNGFIVPFERDVPNNIITVKDGKVYKFARKVDPVYELANDLLIFANSMNNMVIITADTSEYPTNKWYYQLMTVDDTRQYYMNEPLDPLEFVEWDKTSTIPLESSNFIMIKVVVTDSNNTIIAFGKSDIEARD